VSLVRFKFHCNILISGKIIKEMPGSVASGTPCIWLIYLVSINTWSVSIIIGYHRRFIVF